MAIWPSTYSAFGFIFITAAAVVIILITGIFYLKRGNHRLLIQARENWTVFQVMLLLMLPLPFISKNSDIDILLLFIVPFSPFIAKGFLAPQKICFPILCSGAW